MRVEAKPRNFLLNTCFPQVAFFKGGGGIEKGKYRISFFFFFIAPKFLLK